ncbi:MAG: PIG-L family deacetylase [Armatimonas sp.]
MRRRLKLVNRPRWKRAAAVLLTIPPILAGLICGGFYFNIHRQAAAMSVDRMPFLPAPEGAQKRLLVISPHCDDETLGLGGTIAEARKSGAHVTIAFLTNGDGFRVAASRALEKPVLEPKDFVRFAEQRQKEALAAAKTLGVPEEDVVFLGFPDRGLTPMWQTNWSDSTPFRSPYTGQTHSPYSRCQTPNVIYSGQALTHELARLITRVQPTEVYVTHPSDDHPDHAAAPAFARAAIRRSHSSAPLRYYLVHRGDWPLPQGLHPDDDLVPPVKMATLDTLWSATPLTPEARDRKEKALNCYPSQLALCDRFLTSFVRRNEIVGTIPEDSTSLRDPASDNLVRFTNPAADITGVSVRQADSALKLQVTLRGDASPRMRYIARLRGRSDKPDLDPSSFMEVKLQPTRVGNRMVAITTVPLNKLGLQPGQPGRVWVCAESYWTGTLAVDRTGYRELTLNSQPELKL